MTKGGKMRKQKRKKKKEGKRRRRARITGQAVWDIQMKFKD